MAASSCTWFGHILNCYFAYVMGGGRVIPRGREAPVYSIGWLLLHVMLVVTVKQLALR